MPAGKRSLGTWQDLLQREGEESRAALRTMAVEVHEGWDAELSSGKDDSEMLPTNEGRGWLCGWTSSLESGA